MSSVHCLAGWTAQWQPHLCTKSLGTACIVSLSTMASSGIRCGAVCWMQWTECDGCSCDGAWLFVYHGGQLAASSPRCGKRKRCGVVTMILFNS